MLLSPRVVATVLAAVVAAQPPSALRVLSSSPDRSASLTAPVQVIFDRPVAGSLDRTVEAGAIFRIEPAVPGRVEWRDPVTLRFTPAEPLTPGATYRVTISDNFAAMDGSRLEGPYRYEFTVRGPELLTGLPVNAEEHPRFLGREATFEAVYSASVDPAHFRDVAYLEFNQVCGAGRVNRLRVTDQRPIRDTDPWQYREAGGWERDRSADPLRRVVTFTPERPLPLDCGAALILPKEVTPERTGPSVNWGFQTYGPFKLYAAECAAGSICPAGGVRIIFTTPVKGAEVARRVKLLPPVEFAVSDTSEESATWYLEATLTPHTAYAVVVDTAARDVFGQRLEGNPASGFRTTGFAPLVEHEYGRLTVERVGFRTLAVKHVNVDTLESWVAPVPDSLIPGILRWNRWNSDDSTMALVMKRAVARKHPVPGPRDRVRIYGLPLEAYTANRPGTPLLQVVKVSSPQLPRGWQEAQPYAIVQVTDLAVHARVGHTGGVVWVTGVSDGKPRANALVSLYSPTGKLRATARTGADGTALFPELKPDTAAMAGDSFEGYVIAQLAGDRALTSISTYDPDLSPWRFNARAAWGTDRWPMAGAVFTERGIYRPGETVHAKAIARSGLLGDLRVPARGDSLRWLFNDRDGGVLKERVVALSAFGTSGDTVTIPEGAPLGTYWLSIHQRRGGKWQELATASYRVAEYRPPEFLVDAVADSGARFPGDTLVARFEARYLFGAPMARAAMTWSARQVSLDFFDFSIPNTDGYSFGEGFNWWDENSESGGGSVPLAQGEDTLDAAGRATIRVALAPPSKGRPARAVIEGAVTDVNRQVVGAQASVVMHPASF
jgi:hypothetical protein